MNNVTFSFRLDDNFFKQRKLSDIIFWYSFIDGILHIKKNTCLYENFIFERSILWLAFQVSYIKIAQINA